MEVCQFLVSSKADVIAKDQRYDSHSHINTLELAAVIFSICFERSNARLFVSVEGPHCIGLLKEVTWKCASFSSHPKQTSLQKTTCTTVTLIHAFKLAGFVFFDMV